MECFEQRAIRRMSRKSLKKTVLDKIDNAKDSITSIALEGEINDTDLDELEKIQFILNRLHSELKERL